MVKSARMTRGCRRVRIKKPHDWRLSKGQSVAVDGICSTVVSQTKEYFDVEYMSETMAKTTAGLFDAHMLVNLERSLTLNSFIDGHFTLGHVDCRSRVTKIVNVGASKECTVTVPRELMQFIAPRGSITVNGVALTVVRTAASTFTLALIPYTLKHTNLGTLSVGDVVNIEVDVLARYVVAAIRARGTLTRNASKKVRSRE